MLVDGTPQQKRLIAQRHEHLVNVPRAAWLAPRPLGAPCESSTEFVTPSTDRFVRDHDASLKQQFFDGAEAQAEPELPANRTSDDDSREALAVIRRFRFVHRFILPLRVHKPDTAGLAESRITKMAASQCESRGRVPHDRRKQEPGTIGRSRGQIRPPPRRFDDPATVRAGARRVYPAVTR